MHFILPAIRTRLLVISKLNTYIPAMNMYLEGFEQAARRWIHGSLHHCDLT